jgi:acetyl esterase
MPLDPQAQAVIDTVNSLGLPPVWEVTPEQARINAAARPRPAGPEVAAVEDRGIPGPAGDVPVRIYTPEGSGPFPILVWYHGGGWVVGDLDSADPTARHLCKGAACVVVSVDYRLSPETKFPGPADDCFAATLWAANNAGMINGDASRVAVGGDSAGGNLAAAISLMAADRGGPAIIHQLLVYPVTEPNYDTPSYSENAAGFLLARDAMVFYWDAYLASEEDASNPYAAPMKAGSLSGQPAALVITAEFDPLRDEGEAYGRRLQQAGVETTISRYDGMIHGFFGMVGIMDKSGQVMEEATAALRAAFAGAAVPAPADD